MSLGTMSVYIIYNVSLPFLVLLCILLSNFNFQEKMQVEWTLDMVWQQTVQREGGMTG